MSAMVSQPGSVRWVRRDSMKTAMSCVLAVLLIAAVPTYAADPKTEDEKVLYAIGLAMSQNLSWFSLSDAELKMVEQGLDDGVLGRTKKVDLHTYGPKIGELQKSRMTQIAAAEKKSGHAYLEKAAAEKG